MRACTHAALLLVIALSAAALSTEAEAGPKGPTRLLFQFVTNQGGADTGIAIANTTEDPFGTEPEAGTCTLDFFGANAPSPFTTASIAGGEVSVNVASSIAPGFRGYIVAECTFPLAHGMSFVSDVGAQNFGTATLALVLPSGKRKKNESLGN
jgi:hypothetical protein